MKQINYKKLILPNIPYVFFVYLFDKVGQAVRLAPGADISAKILNITQGFSAAFESALPSIYPLDLLVGIVGAVIIRLIVYGCLCRASTNRGCQSSSGCLGAYSSFQRSSRRR